MEKIEKYKLIQYGFDYKEYRTEEDLASQLGENWRKKIFEIVFNSVLTQLFPQGLKGPQARSHTRILDALDQTESYSIELSVADAEFLKSVFLNENASIAPAQARIFCVIQDEIEKAFKK